MTDRYLDGLWSKAVRAIKGECCANPMCGKQASGVHHIIKRRYKVTRWDVKNGIPLCPTCHPIADRNTGFALSLITGEDADYLNVQGMHTLKDWLAISQQTREEFMKGCAVELKELINRC